MAKVLTVDDSKVVRTMVGKHLQPYGCRLLEAASGPDGLATAQRERPDLILLDICMPGTDGRQTLAAIRTDEATRAIPVIMLADEDSRERLREVVGLGVQGYLVKPFTREGFEREVSKVLGAAPAAAPRPSFPAAPPPALAVNPRAVLVIDDSERVLGTARAVLAPAVDVTVATRGAEGVRRWRDARAGVALIDLTMPELDGFETLQALRAVGGQKLHAIALLVRGDEDARVRARKAGFAAIVEKPLQAADLCREVALGVAVVGSGEMVVFEESGCPVVVCPDPQMTSFAQFGAAAERTLRNLAEEGRGSVIFDLGAVIHANTTLVKALLGLMQRAGGLGLRTAVCGPVKVAEQLRQQPGDGTVCAPSRAAARELLG